MKLLIMGLPGVGKTTLALELAKIMGAVHFNADECRDKFWPDLGYSIPEREMQARRMSNLCEIAQRSGKDAIADFICPTKICQAIFDADYTIWIHRDTWSPYADETLNIFSPPQGCIALTGDYNISKTVRNLHWSLQFSELKRQNFQ